MPSPAAVLIAYAASVRTDPLPSFRLVSRIALPSRDADAVLTLDAVAVRRPPASQRD